MFFPNVIGLTFALAPLLVLAAIFPKDTVVKMLDANSFEKTMKENVLRIY